ncbi:MAG: glucose-6-phosphate isomerase [Phycisphaerales bacterium]|nr:glucose-6-phosphate isomerase [Phycisphaerales bacterium]
MNTNWLRYQKYLCECLSVGLTLDISRMNFSDDFLEKMKPLMAKSFASMTELEGGSIANPDENRQVGHYWLRDAELAPAPAQQKAITETIARIKAFAEKTHQEQKFTNLLVIGIGGSALGPQFVADSLTSPADKMKVFFFDNTDPDGMDRTLSQLDLQRTLTLVISKSGSTAETRNGMLVAMKAYENAGLRFAEHAVAITGEKSELDQKAEQWLDRFPMWDWVGGRTSELSAVGLLPAALQGFNIDAMLDGAKEMDRLTRNPDPLKNPAALLALMWHYAGDGHGAKDMVILPYKDRLLLFSRYLQQLIMESLGKEFDLNQNIVHQGIAVYGNKGSTDQHAYVQQLREGINNFFVTFIEVLKDPSQGNIASSSSQEVEPNVTPGDYLNGFFQGTRTALSENGRESMTITIDEVNPRTIGVLIALFERAVGLYAFMVNINAYHQPGVEAGKKAANAVINRQLKILQHLHSSGMGTAEQIAEAIGESHAVESVFLTLRHLVANHRVQNAGSGTATVFSV